MTSHVEDLRKLEESLWVAETRYDIEYMESVLAPTSVEFARSGRRYDRAAVLAFPPEPPDVRLPLPAFSVRPLTREIVLVTYRSEVRCGERLLRASRSSIWHRTPAGWRLEFHQGTPIE